MKVRTIAIAFAVLIAASAGATAQSIQRLMTPQNPPRSGDGRANSLSVTVNPHNPPITVPSAGGSFDFSVQLGNDEAAPASFEMWTMLEQPDGSLVGPLYGPEEFLLPSAWTSSNDLSHELATTAPVGPYTLHVYLGQYPGPVWASASFDLSKAELTAPWYEQTAGTSNFIFDVFFADENNGWASGMLQTMFRTTDGGDNWYAQPLPPSSHYYGVYFVDALEGWTVGDNGKIAHTEDGGSTWTVQPSGTNYHLFDVFFIDDTTGWIAGGRFTDFSPGRQLILKTTDGGETWSTVFVQSYSNPLKAIYFADASSGWAVGEGGAALHTTDGGATWTEQDTPSLLHLNDVFFFADGATGWAAGRSGTLLHTTNRGLTWEQSSIVTGAELTEVTFTDAQNGWVVGGYSTDGVVFRTSDGGATWVEQDAGGARSLSGVFFVDPEKGWAVGYDGTIVHTITGGE